MAQTYATRKVYSKVKQQVRTIRLTEPKDINTPEVEALIAQAVLPYESAFLAARENDAHECAQPSKVGRCRGLIQNISFH